MECLANYFVDSIMMYSSFPFFIFLEAILVVEKKDYISLFFNLFWETRIQVFPLVLPSHLQVILGGAASYCLFSC